MLKLVWVNPRDPQSGDAWAGAEAAEAAEAQPAGDVPLWNGYSWLRAARTPSPSSGACGGC